MHWFCALFHKLDEAPLCSVNEINLILDLG